MIHFQEIVYATGLNDLRAYVRSCDEGYQVLLYEIEKEKLCPSIFSFEKIAPAVAFACKCVSRWRGWTSPEIQRIVDWLSARERISELFFPAIRCADGWEISAQAGLHFYSCPRGPGPWTHFECGGASSLEPRLARYRVPLSEEEPENENLVNYPFVPARLLAEVILSHGGPA